MSARIPGTMDFCLFADWDQIVDKEIKENLPWVQDLFEIGDFHVLSTGEFHRHGICVDRLTMREVVQILEQIDCDYNFKRGVKLNERRTWILRVCEKGARPKPEYQYTINSPHNGKNLQSEAHALFLKYYYEVPVRLVNPDGNTKLDIQDYLTATRVNDKLVDLSKFADWLNTQRANEQP